MLFPENTDTTTGLTMLQPEIVQQQPESIVRKPEMVQQKPELIMQRPVLIDPGPGSNDQNGELGAGKRKSGEKQKIRSEEAKKIRKNLTVNPGHLLDLFPQEPNKALFYLF